MHTKHSSLPLIVLAHLGRAAGALRGLQEQNWRIIGGGNADKGEYPYAVSLKGRGGHFCGGSLIARDVVLSAAHCGQDGNYKVVVGRHSRNSWSEGEEISVFAEVPHPSYVSQKTDNDFSLIFLSREVRANVEIVRLNPDGDTPDSGERLTTMGWGDTIASQSQTQLSTVLQEAEVTALSNAECSRAAAYVGGFYQSYRGAITDNMLCARAPGRDSCQGDSGGPLVVKGGGRGGADVQVGVVSWGMGCASASFPGVYARVSAAYPWIRNEVCRRSSDPPAHFDCDSVVKYDFATCGTDAWNMADYRGTIAVTASGKTCQAWSSQSPHTHTRTPAQYPNGGLGDHNYCRNPDNDDKGAWCYTTDPGSRWEYCTIPDCASSSPTDTAPVTTPANTPPPTPRPTPPPTLGPNQPSTTTPASDGSNQVSTTCGTASTKQADYRGDISTTTSGKTCQAWSSQTPHTHTRTETTYPNTGLGDHNHCRNPDGNERAWCYTADPGSRWEFCNVPVCAPSQGGIAPAPPAPAPLTPPPTDGGSGGGFLCSVFGLFC